MTVPVIKRHIFTDGIMLNAVDSWGLMLLKHFILPVLSTFCGGALLALVTVWFKNRRKKKNDGVDESLVKTFNYMIDKIL